MIWDPLESRNIASSRQRPLILALLCVGVLVVMMDNTIVNVALPVLGRQLSADSTELQWIVDSYSLVFATMLIPAGAIGDRVGRKSVLLIGLVGFSASSVLAATSLSSGQLILFRFALGIFAALIYPSTLSIILSVYEESTKRSGAIGAWSAASGMAVAIGPVVGGWLLEKHSWTAVFWINVPLAIVLAIALWFVVPRDRARISNSFDMLGLLLAASSVGALVYYLIESPRNGWLGPNIWWLVFSVATFALFITYERKAPNPLLELFLFRDPSFSLCVSAIFVAFFGLFGFVFLMTQYLQSVRGYSPLVAGICTLPFAAGMVVFAPLAMKLSSRFGSVTCGGVGLLIMAGGFSIAFNVERGSSYGGIIVPAMVLLAIGLALVQGPATDMTMASLPASKFGVGAAVNDTARELGGTLGVAVLGSVSAAAFNVDRVFSVFGGDFGVDLASDRSISSINEIGANSSAPAGVINAVKDEFVHSVHRGILVALIMCTLVGCGMLIFRRRTPSC